MARTTKLVNESFRLADVASIVGESTDTLSTWRHRGLLGPTIANNERYHLTYDFAYVLRASIVSEFAKANVAISVAAEAAAIVADLPDLMATLRTGQQYLVIRSDAAPELVSNGPEFNGSLNVEYDDGKATAYINVEKLRGRLRTQASMQLRMAQAEATAEVNTEAAYQRYKRSGGIGRNKRSVPASGKAADA